MCVACLITVLRMLLVIVVLMEKNNGTEMLVAVVAVSFLAGRSLVGLICSSVSVCSKQAMLCSVLYVLPAYCL